MKHTLALAALFWFAAPLYAIPPTVPDPIKCAVGEDIQVTVTVEAGKKGAYAPGFDTADCLLFRGYSPDETTMTFLVRPKKAAKFYVPFWTVGESAYSTLIVDASGGVPPGPTPPVPPGPTDPLWATLQTAYAADLGITKSTQARMLADVYRKASVTTVSNAALTTVGMLHDAVGGAAQVIVPLPALNAVRQVFATDMKSRLPVDPNTPLTPALRDACRDLFARNASYLEALAK